jgi:hypothetical protein
MKKITTILIYLVFLTKIVYAQGNVGLMINGRFSDLDVRQGGMVTEIKPQVPAYVGTKHLYDDWRLGSLKLFSNEKYENVFILYNIEDQFLEIKNSNISKKFYVTEIDVFQILGDDNVSTRKFINTKNLNLPIPLLGFLELLTDGQNKLFARHLIETKKAYYVDALAVGNRSDEKYKVEKYFALLNRDFKELPKNKKEIVALFGDKTKSMEEYISKNKLNVKKREDLIKLIEFSNSLNTN